MFIALWVGAVILLCNFGYEWYTDKQCVKTQYKGYVFPPNQEQEIEAEIGIHIGLQGFNVSLDEVAFESCRGDGNGDSYYSDRPFPYESIFYNEAFRWNSPWAQGRLRFAGQSYRELYDARLYGIPYPILWIAEYFTLDGDQIRWGRKFRIAGWYTYIFMW